MDGPIPEEIIDIEGPEGETIFWHGKRWLIENSASSIQAHMDEMWEHYRDVEDDRLLALIGALCVENSLDGLLQGFAPGFKKFVGDTDLTMALKTKIAQSLRLLPVRILTACNLIRQIRNEFAHNLAYKQLGQLDNKFLRKLEPYVTAFNEEERDSADYRGLLSALIGFVLLALRVYTGQTSLLRQYIESTPGREGFKKWAEEIPSANPGAP